MTQLRRVCDVYDAIDSDDALTRSWTIDWKEGQMRVCNYAIDEEFADRTRDSKGDWKMMVPRSTEKRVKKWWACYVTVTVARNEISQSL